MHCHTHMCRYSSELLLVLLVSENDYSYRGNSRCLCDSEEKERDVAVAAWKQGDYCKEWILELYKLCFSMF